MTKPNVIKMKLRDGSDAAILQFNGDKILSSEGYKLLFRYNDGFTVRTGSTKTNDPDPMLGLPELADIEISTICHGVEGSGPCKFCSPPGSLVSTTNGDIPIENIAVGDSVISVELNTRHPYIKENVVKEIYERNYTGDIVIVESDDGKVLRLTPEHEILLTSGVTIKAKDIKPDDEILTIDEFGKCRHCNKLLIPSNRYSRYYCSENCFNTNHKKICMICGKEFISNSKIGKFCCVTIDTKSTHPLLNTYYSMLYRCYDKSRNNYKDYGAKGILVCTRWLTFSNFVEDMGNRPKGYTLDRINNDKGYSKDNCRWVSVEEQRINRDRFKNTTRKYKGVSKYGDKWKVVARHKTKSIYLGLFEDERTAAIAYNDFIKTIYPDTYKMYINKVEEVKNES